MFLFLGIFALVQKFGEANERMVDGGLCPEAGLVFRRAVLTQGGALCWEREKKKNKNPKRLILRRLLLPAEDVLVLQQYELHYLVLVDHVDRHVPGLGFGPQQRGAEHDGHALGGHAVFLSVVDHPGGTRES